MLRGFRQKRAAPKEPQLSGFPFYTQVRQHDYSKRMRYQNLEIVTIAYNHKAEKRKFLSHQGSENTTWSLEQSMQQEHNHN